jgi:hypothetical protein
VATGEYKVVDETIKKDAGGTKYVYVGIDMAGSVGGDVATKTSSDYTNRSSTTTEGKIYEYVVAADGTYTLKTATDLQAASVTVAKNTATVTGYANATTAFATSATKLTVVNYAPNATTATVKTYTGIANFPDTSIVTTLSGKDDGAHDSAVIEKDSNNKITNIYIVKNSAATVASTPVNYAVYTGVGETDSTGTLYNFVVNGESVSYYADNTNAGKLTGATAPAVVGLSVDADNNATVSVIRTAENATASSTSACQVLVDGKVKVVDDSYVVVAIGGTNYTVYFADSYKVVDGTYTAPATATYAATTFAVDDTITIYKDAVGASGKAAFIVKVNPAA